MNTDKHRWEKNEKVVAQAEKPALLKQKKKIKRKKKS